MIAWHTLSSSRRHCRLVVWQGIMTWVAVAVEVPRLVVEVPAAAEARRLLLAPRLTRRWAGEMPRRRPL
jgi:hypothetical protein